MALTADGLEIRRLPEVLADIETSLQNNVDENIDANPDTALGQIMTIFAASIAGQEALSQAVYDNFNPLKAEGRNLDDLVAIIGISRIAASATFGNLTAIGVDGTTIPAGSLFASPITNDQFTNLEVSLLSALTCLSATLSVGQLLNNTTYTVIVNSTQYDYLSDGDATNLEILNGLEALITADVAATWSAVVDTGAETLAITTDELRISVVSPAFLSTVEISDSVAVQATVTGPIIAPANTITQAVSSIVGLTSVNNPVAFQTGNIEETDELLRQRFLVSQQFAGTATVESITDSVRNVAGVSSALVVENDQIAVDVGGRPGKSFETIVQGGDEDDVALTIWRTKPAGIETFGSTTIIIQDQDGQDQTINFTRPTAINLAFRVTYTLYNEEMFPVDGEAEIKQIMVDETTDLGLGVDVITQRYFGPIYANVTGIDTLLVEVQQITNPGDTPLGGSWQTASLPIDIDEFASTTLIDVIIVAA